MGAEYLRFTPFQHTSRNFSLQRWRCLLTSSISERCAFCFVLLLLLLLLLNRWENALFSTIVNQCLFSLFLSLVSIYHLFATCIPSIKCSSTFPVIFSVFSLLFWCCFRHSMEALMRAGVEIMLDEWVIHRTVIVHPIIATQAHIPACRDIDLLIDFERHDRWNAWQTDFDSGTR